MSWQFISQTDLEDDRVLRRTRAAELLTPSVAGRQHVVDRPSGDVHFDNDVLFRLDLRIPFNPDRDRSSAKDLSTHSQDRTQARTQSVLSGDFDYVR